MKASEALSRVKLFKVEVERYTNDELLDAWIKHEALPYREPDVDLQKEIILEAALIQRFGLSEWSDAVSARKRAKSSLESE